MFDAKKYRNKRYKDLRSKGLCVKCKQPSDLKPDGKPYTNCKKCRPRINHNQNNRKDYLYANCKCIRCSGDNFTERKYCDKCREKIIDYNNRKRDERNANKHISNNK